MADIAATALELGRPTTVGVAANHATTDAPGVADVWISGDLGFVLLLHRRKDGLVAEELYYSVRHHNGPWERPDHLSGGILGVETADPSAVEGALAGAPMAVVAESESLVDTGRDASGDEGELIYVCEILVGSEVDLIEIERFSEASPELSALSRREVTGPLVLVVLLPGERARVSAMRRENSSLTRLGGTLDMRSPEQ